MEISIHAPPRGATGRSCASPSANLHFNSRPSARGDSKSSKRIVCCRLFQFTPLREGRRFSASRYSIYKNISIHAPPRGATDGCGGGGVKKSISIHAPPRGATLSMGIHSTEDVFQFTPLREGRRDAQAPPRKEEIFQFTPLREGRPAAQAATHKPDRFQFTPLREGRRACRFLVFCGFPFQFTPLREGRHEWLTRRNRLHHFNSRPSARGDGGGPQLPGLTRGISIHAPPRGATALSLPTIHGVSISIHAPPRGATSGMGG